MVNVAIASKVGSKTVSIFETALLGARNLDGTPKLWEITLWVALPTIHLKNLGGRWRGESGDGRTSICSVDEGVKRRGRGKGEKLGDMG